MRCLLLKVAAEVVTRLVVGLVYVAQLQCYSLHWQIALQRVLEELAALAVQTVHCPQLWLRAGHHVTVVARTWESKGQAKLESLQIGWRLKED